MPGFDPPEHHPAGGERTCRLAKWRSVPQSPGTRDLGRRFHVSWETQGRQSHGWFGHGMGPGTDRTAEGDADRLFDPGNLAGRVAWVAHGAIMHLPRAEWHRQAIAFDGARVERLCTAMAAWTAARSLGEDAFEKRFTGVSTSATAVRKLRAAAEGASVARTHEDLARASADLAGGMQGVGLERWPSFLQQVAETADASHQTIASQELVAQVIPPGGQNADRTMSADGQAALAQREGHVVGNSYYNDGANNCTYGVGLLAHTGPCTEAELHRTVNAGEAEAEFQRRVNDAAQRVREQVQGRRLTQNEFDALVSATYNTRREDNQRFLRLANQGDDAAVARQLGDLTHTHDHDPQGNRVGPARPSRGLTRRRDDEIRQYRTR